MAISNPRLDLLIYAHDGRGLGHASRGVAVGAAVRRLYPELKVLFLSGCRQTAALIGPVPLDWIKLPAYEKVIVKGTPQARVGKTNLKNSYLVKSRTRLLQAIMAEYRPRCVLVDHEAPGKRAELVPAIESTPDTSWILGLRGIIGRVEDVWSQAALRIFKKHYRALFWYGDESVLGRETLHAIENRYQVQPFITGYISRLKEMLSWTEPAAQADRPNAGTIAVSWNSPAATSVLTSLHQALARMGGKNGPWRIFTGSGKALFKDLSFCRVEDLSPTYLSALLNSKTALVYGGYNSITDILSAEVPSLILLRDVSDREQEDHLAKLAASGRTALRVMPETDVSADRLQAALEELLHTSWPQNSRLNLDGAENAAKKIVEYL
jgi:predicted glycosyltransferase